MPCPDPVSHMTSGGPSWTDVATAIGTVGAVVVALFGNFLPRLFPPKLSIAVVNPRGVRQQVWLGNIQSGGFVINTTHTSDARFYQLTVKNSRRWVRAHNVRAVLQKIEQRTTVGWVEVWSGGGIPLVWQHESALGTLRTLGPAQLADLFHVLKDQNAQGTKALVLTPIFGPYGVELARTVACELRVTVQAESDEADSAPLVVTINWDGQWEDGAMEMENHLRLEQATA